MRSPCMQARGKGSSPGRVEGSSRAMLATARPSCYSSLLVHWCEKWKWSWENKLRRIAAPHVAAFIRTDPARRTVSCRTVAGRMRCERTLSVLRRIIDRLIVRLIDLLIDWLMAGPPWGGRSSARQRRRQGRSGSAVAETWRSSSSTWDRQTQL